MILSHFQPLVETNRTFAVVASSTTPFFLSSTAALLAVNPGRKPYNSAIRRLGSLSVGAGRPSVRISHFHGQADANPHGNSRTSSNVTSCKYLMSSVKKYHSRCSICQFFLKKLDVNKINSINQHLYILCRAIVANPHLLKLKNH